MTGPGLAEAPNIIQFLDLPPGGTHGPCRDTLGLDRTNIILLTSTEGRQSTHFEDLRWNQQMYYCLWDSV